MSPFIQGFLAGIGLTLLVIFVLVARITPTPKEPTLEEKVRAEVLLYDVRRRREVNQLKEAMRRSAAAQLEHWRQEPPS